MIPNSFMSLRGFLDGFYSEFESHQRPRRGASPARNGADDSDFGASLGSTTVGIYEIGTLEGLHS